MKTSLKLAVPALLGLLLSHASGGVYSRAAALIGSPSDLDFSGYSEFAASLGTSAGFSLAAGYQFAWFSVEGEWMYLRNGIDSVSQPTESATGTLKNSTFFVNALVDIPVPIPLLTPYLGAGVGVAQADLDLTTTITPLNTLTSATFADSSTVLGWQLMAGLKCKIWKGLKAYAGYRYFDPSAGDLSSAIANSLASVRTGKVHLFEIGAFYAF